MDPAVGDLKAGLGLHLPLSGDLTPLEELTGDPDAKQRRAFHQGVGVRAMVSTPRRLQGGMAAGRSKKCLCSSDRYPFLRASLFPSLGQARRQPVDSWD